MGKILDGKLIAKAMRENIATQVRVFKDSFGRSPRLDVVMVGDDPASHVYVRNKSRACEEVGMRSFVHQLSLRTTRGELLKRIIDLNADDDIDGILVQYPLPEPAITYAVARTIDPRKDVDGLHPCNLGSLLVGHGSLSPCTPSGCMHLLDHARVALKGSHVVIVGRSDIVGKPMALLALHHDATVTVAHSHTKYLDELCREADVLIVAAGKPHLVRGSWIKSGAVVIDVGITRGGDGKLVGDVVFSEAIERAAWVTPVPGGVGPMTIACLLENTLQAAKARM